MVYVKVVKENENHSVCESLNVMNGYVRGNGIDRVYVTSNPLNEACGYIVTREDFEKLYEQKKKRFEKEKEAKMTEEERKRKEELEEIRKWKEEKAMEERTWYKKIIRFFKK